MAHATLAAWRAQRTQVRTLPSGLSATLRKVQLLDLAAQGQIPTSLVGRVESLIAMSDQGGGAIDLADFPQHAAVINLVAKAALVDPPAADEPDDDHIGISELPFGDRLDIFNWAQEEGVALATFPEPAAEPGARTPRGRQRVQGATLGAAPGVAGGLGDRSRGADPGDAGANHVADDHERSLNDV